MMWALFQITIITKLAFSVSLGHSGTQKSTWFFQIPKSWPADALLVKIWNSSFAHPDATGNMWNAKDAKN